MIKHRMPQRETHQASIPEPPGAWDDYYWTKQRILAGLPNVRPPLRRITLRMWLAGLLRRWADRLDP